MVEQSSCKTFARASIIKTVSPETVFLIFMTTNAFLPRTIIRPTPPSSVIEPALGDSVFVASFELSDFVDQAFLDPDSKLYNSEHGHLHAANIGFLWTNEPNERNMMPIGGTAEIPKPHSGGKWQKARQMQQFREWFGDDELDFLITFYAPWIYTLNDESFCSALEHELYHCGHARDRFGGYRFRENGQPVFGILGHDVEEHTGVVRRYGPGAAAGNTARLVEYALLGPELDIADIEAMCCGTCMTRN